MGNTRDILEPLIKQKPMKIMIEKELKDIILQVVREKNGLNSITLVLNVMRLSNIQKFSPDKYNKIIEQLIKSGDIIKLEYIRPHIGIKFMYFIKGTTFPNIRSMNAQDSEKESNTEVVNKSRNDV